MKCKKIRSILGIILSFVLIFTSVFTVFAEDENPNEPVDKNSIKAEIAISDNPYFYMKAGKVNDFEVTLRNLTGWGASNLIIQPVVEGVEKNPFNISFVDNNNFITTFAGRGKKQIKMQAYVDPEAENKTYTVTLNYTYFNKYNIKFTGSDKIYIKVSDGGEDTEKTSLSITNFKEPTGQFNVNENFDVGFTLINQGTTEAKNIKITATCVEGTAVVPKSLSVQSLNSLAGGVSKDFVFTFAGTSSAKTQNYAIEFNVEYEDGSKDGDKNNVVSFKKFSGVNIVNPKADEKEEEEEEKNISRPKIIVNDYECDPIIVKAGEEFDLTMYFKNTHREKEAKNVKIFLTLAEETSSESAKTGNIFTPVDSSNTFFFDTISPNGIQSKKLRLFTMPDAQPKTYTLTVNFDYEDSKGNQFKDTELLGINVKQSTKVETGDIYIPEVIEAGMPVNLSFDFYNTGKVQVSNFMIKLEGEGLESQNKSTYFGNIDSGNSEYYDGTFYINNEGPANIKVILGYDDPSGEHFETVHEFNVNVTAPMPVDDGMNGGMIDGEIPEEGMSKGKIAIIAGTIIGAIVVVLIVVALLKKRKARLEAEFLAKDEDEATEENE